MRRSSSVSHIPVFKSESKGRSISTNRTSIKDNAGSTIHTRKPSVDRALKRSNSLTSFRQTITTPLGAAGSSNYLKPSNCITPASGRGRSPIRSSVKKDRPVNDKKRISEQFVKIRKFIENHKNCDPNIANNLKPPTINTFVYVIGILLNEIDFRIQIKMSNYMQAVPLELKALRYPGTISNSLLKTVNTMHSWPHVINIFSWLIDVIGFVHSVHEPIKPISENSVHFNLTEAIHDDITQKYTAFNKNEVVSDDAEKLFLDKLSNILNIDEDKIKETEAEVATLRNLIEKQQTKLNKKLDANKAIKEENERKLHEIESFNIHDDLLVEGVEKEIEKLKEKKHKLNYKVISISETIEKLKEIISKQTYTITEVKQIQVHIEELKHTIGLKKDMIETWSKVCSENDYNLVELKKNVETEVYRLNSSLLQPGLIYPDFNCLKLRDHGFFGDNFKDEILNTIEKKKQLENVINKTLKELESEITEKSEKILLIKFQLPILEKEIEKLQLDDNELKKKIQSTEQNIKMVQKEIEQKEKEFLDAMNELSKQEPDCKPLEIRKAELEAEILQNKKDLDVLQVKCIDFFDNIYHQVMSTLVEMVKIYDNVMQILDQNAQDVITQQNQIIEDLQKLEEISN